MTAKKPAKNQEPTATPSAAIAAPVFDISQFRAPQNYVWRKVEREGEDEGEPRQPIWVYLLDLSIQQTNDLPWGLDVALRESMEVAAQHVAKWDFEAEDVKTGKMVPVPPPSVAGWEVFELLTNSEASAIINWLKVPHYMKSEAGKRTSERLGEGQGASSTQSNKSTTISKPSKIKN